MCNIQLPSYAFCYPQKYLGAILEHMCTVKTHIYIYTYMYVQSMRICIDMHKNCWTLAKVNRALQLSKYSRAKRTRLEAFAHLQEGRARSNYDLRCRLTVRFPAAPPLSE